MMKNHVFSKLYNRLNYIAAFIMPRGPNICH